MSEIALKSTQFRQEREKRWRELERLVTQVEKRGIRSLTADELHDLPVLYRGVISSLSVARSISLDRNVLEYLEGLAVRSYFVVYSPRRRPGEVVIEYLTHSFPQAVRDLKVWVALSMAVTVVGFLAAYGMTLSNLDNYDLFVSPDYSAGRNPSSTREELRAVLMNEGEKVESQSLGVFATFLFTHNAQIGLLCYALGAVPLLLVGLLLIQNGLILGAFAALHEQKGLSVELWSWLLPHGVTELLAVMLCGGAGFAVGMAAIFPGRRTRLESMVVAGRRAGVIAIGCVGMFFIAALIEGFFRQLVNDLTIRYSVALITGLFWIYYFGWVGRKARPA